MIYADDINILTPWCRILFKKLTVTRLIKKYPFFMELKSSSPCSQKPATGPYPEPAESSSPHRSLREVIRSFLFLRTFFPSTRPETAKSSSRNPLRAWMFFLGLSFEGESLNDIDSTSKQTCCLCEDLESKSRSRFRL